MYNSDTIYSNFTPIAKSAVIGYRISGPLTLVILTNLTNFDFSKRPNFVFYKKLYDQKKELIDKNEINQALTLLDRCQIEIDDFLNNWRFSDPQSILTGNDLRVGYMGMVELTVASWYANPRSWGFCGYAGPPVLF